MREILFDVYLYAILVSAEILLIGLIYIYSNKKSIKYLTLVFCVIGFFTIFYFDNMFKGYPREAVEGKHRVQGWEISEIDRQIYVMVLDENKIPMNFYIPFQLNDALALQEVSENIGIYKEISLVVELNDDTGEKLYRWILEKRFKDPEVPEEVNSNIINDFSEEDPDVRNFNPVEDPDVIEQINKDYPKPN